MEVASAQSCAENSECALEEIADTLAIADRGAPDFVAVHFGAGRPCEALRDSCSRQLGAAALHGGSSCLGVMTQTGVNIESGAGVAVLAIWDEQGSYGSASVELGPDPESAARKAAKQALHAAKRDGEVPEMVWLTVAPGREEAVLAGLRGVVGPETLIVGGSSADNEVTGDWAQFGPETSHSDGLVVSVLFPSSPVASFYQRGYTPTGDSGKVTRIKGRRLYEIDGQPAAAIYSRWTDGAVQMAEDEPISILADATLWPLGRVTRHVAGVPFHLLAHPARTYPDGSMELFADLLEGDQIWQMQGSADRLVARAGRIAAQARNDAGNDIAAAFVIYCGGCMLAVRERMEEVRAGINTALGEAPWIGVFTFGEQGVPSGGQAEHGNLMISCTVIADPQP